MPDFLLEIGCEEIPARMIDAAREQLLTRTARLVEREHLSQSGTRFVPLSTPRRLTITIHQILGRQPDTEEHVQGPAVNVAFKDGSPTAAAEAFAKKTGLPITELQRKQTAKGEYLIAKVVRKGR